jgi:hypothetical protein
VSMVAQAQTRYHLDCFRRHYKFTESTSQKYDASNFYLKVS